LNMSCGNLAEIIILYAFPEWMLLHFITNTKTECENPWLTD
jgi:hypothetical protein